MLPIRLLAFLLFASSALAAQIAPLPPQIAPLSYDDRFPDSATNGDSTLVVWTNEFSPYLESHSIEMRLLDSLYDRLAMTLARGYAPRVTTNGSEYLVGYSIGGSRFSTYPYDNVAVTIVNTDGSRGATRAINNSVSGGIGGVAWNGTHWVVGFTSDASARAVLLARDLSMQFVDLGAGRTDSIVEIDGAMWALRDDPAAASSELVEIRSDATTGRRFPIAADQVRIVPTDSGALAFISAAGGIAVARFDSTSGFSPIQSLSATASLHDVEQWNGGALLLVAPAESTSVVGVAVDSEGAIVQTTDLLTAVAPSGQLALGEARNGLLLFEARLDSDVTGYGRFNLYAYELTALAPLDPMSGELISIADIARQHSGSIVTAADHALAVWTQTIGTRGNEAVFTRTVGPDGKPIGDPIQLPLTFYGSPSLVPDGDAFILLGVDASGKILAARLSSDGRLLGPASEVGVGSSPAIAKSGDDLFAVWVYADGQIRGTPLRHDGSPVVPGGFAILPKLVGAQGGPAIAAAPQGFQLLWSEPSVTSVIISPAGTPLSRTEVSDDVPQKLLLASSTHSALAAWRPIEGPATLYAFGDGRPFEAFDPNWGDTWSPILITRIAEDRYLVVIVRSAVVFTSEVTMSGAFITGITPLREIGPWIPTEHGVAMVNGSLLLLTQAGRELHVMSAAPTRVRAVRR